MSNAIVYSPGCLQLPRQLPKQGWQIWIPQILPHRAGLDTSCCRDPCPEGLRCPGVIFPNSPEAEHTPATIHQAAGCLAAKPPVLVSWCHEPHCVWGCLPRVLSKETPRADAEEEFPGWILIRNRSGVRLLSLKPAPVHMHRKGPAGPFKI